MKSGHEQLYDDDDDLGAADLAASVFGPESPTMRQSDDGHVANHPFAEQLNGRYEGFPSRNEAKGLPPADRQRIEALALLVSRIMRNTNITAALPAHVAPTIWSEPIDLTAKISLPAAADAPGVWHNIFTFTVPPGRWVRLSGMGIDADGGFTFNGDILWRILINGQPVPTLSSFGEQRGSPSSLRPIVIIAEQGWTIQFQVRRQVAGASSTEITGVLNGWSWRLRNDYDRTRASNTAS